MKTNHSIDAKLVVKFQSGDKKALARLVKRWHLVFCKKAYWIVKDADLSKDIAQESWRTIMDKIEDLKNPKRFSSWALRIVYSKSLDAIRYHTKELHKKEKYAIEYKEMLVEEKKENKSLKIQLLDALKTLPSHQQHVVTLFYVQEYTLKEISAILNISIGTVKSRLFHAREQLKQKLKQYNYEMSHND